MQRTNQLNARIQRVDDLKQKTFNIISHQGPPRRIESLPTLIKDHSAHRPYHMLTNMPKPLHHDAPTVYDEDYSLTVYKQTILPRANTSTGNRREFNIVSNEYFENPAEKKREEYEKLKSHVLKKYWQTHDFDIVKGRYCSPEKEDRYQTQLKIMQEVQGRAVGTSLPPGVEYADGHSYNILTHDIYDDSRLQAATTMEQRQLNRIKKRQVETAQREAGEKAYEFNETRRLSRISRQKYDSALDSGFNPITNEKVSNDRPLPVPERPPTMWARITMQPTSSSSSSSRVQQSAADFDHSRIPSPQQYSATGTFRDLSGTSTAAAASVPFQAAMLHRHGTQVEFGQPAAPVSRVHTGYSSSANHHTNSNSNNNNHDNGHHQASSRPPMTTSKAVPSLDISRAEFGEPVVYQEPVGKAPPGATVAMVRTGGLSSYR